MKQLKHYIILLILLLTSVMSKADDITYTVSTNYDTYSGSLAYMTDGSTTTYFWSNGAQSTGNYVLITFSESVDLTSFSTYSSSSTDYPHSCNELQVSSDGTTWTTIGTFSDAQTSTFSNITNAKGIQYARIYALSSDSHWLYINEITMTYTAASTSDTTTKTYTRNSVTAGNWESFCLPMNIDMGELQENFDKIYIAYRGETLDWYDDLTDAPTIGTKRRKATSTTTSSTITATAEAYSEETGYWTEDEQLETQRYCFAYSADGSTYYHYYIADFTSETGLVIPQGMPFFAHVKEGATGLTDGTLTLSGFLYSDETEKTGLITRNFKVYTDTSLQNLSTAKTFSVLGELTAGTYSTEGTLYTINADGTFSTTTTMEQNHAYLNISPSAEVTIKLYPTTCTDLESITTITPDEPSGRLDLTDDAPTLVAGTYKAGNVTYTRTVNNYYAGFNVPFSVDLRTMTANFQAVYTPAGFAIYNPDKTLLTTFYKRLDMTSTLPANTPFLAVMTTDDKGNKQSQNVRLTSSTQTTITANTADPTPVKMKVYDYGFNGGLATTSTHYTVSYGGSLNTTSHIQSDGYYIVTGADGSWGYVDGDFKAFREYVIILPISSAGVKEININAQLEDSATTISDILAPSADASIYDISGRKLANHKLNTLPRGIYIQGGKKIIK